MKKSISLSEKSEHFISKVSSLDGGPPKWSSTINIALSQIQDLLTSNMPELSNEDWESLLHVFRDEDQIRNLMVKGRYQQIHFYILDSYNETELQTYGENLAKKVRSMTGIEKVAILYFLQIHANNDWNSFDSFSSIKKAILLKLKGQIYD
mgnify:CR=1 FL=1